MFEHAVLSPVSVSEPDALLASLMASGIDPALVEQLQGVIQTLVQAETKRCIQAETLRLEAQFDQRVAHQVALKIQQIIEQNRLARHRQFGPSSEAGQGSLFNEVELPASQPEPGAASRAATSRPHHRPA